jgi:hypothetical protein
MKKRFNPAALLLFIPPLVMGFSCFALETIITREKFNEKYLDIKHSVQRIMYHAEQLFAVTGNWDDCEESLIIHASALDSIPGIFAALYNADFQTVSHRTLTYANAFDPLNYRQFRAMAQHRTNGEMILTFKPEDGRERKMSVYFQWERGYVMAVGLSAHSVETHISRKVLIIFLFAWGLSVIIIMLASWLYLKMELKNMERMLHDKP